MTFINANVISSRMNVLVYSGNGTTVDSVRHCMFTLRRLLAGNYAVIPMTTRMLLDEPWMSSCALLVIPGGADLPYCRSLNGAGNRRIAQFVKKGGAYLGFCAGGYYASARCEFELGDPKMEVKGPRELAFYPGTCRGCAFKGFVYGSVAGARAARLSVAKDALTAGTVPQTFRSYYNGGGIYADAAKLADKGVEVLATYDEKLDVDGGDAAVVYCKVGDGSAVLMGPHPEYAPASMDRSKGGPEYSAIIDELLEDDKQRNDFLKACLAKLGLRVNQENTSIPSLSQFHISGVDQEGASKLIDELRQKVEEEDGKPYIKDENDTFLLVESSSLHMDSIKDALKETEQSQDQGEQSFDDYNATVKTMVTHEKPPTPKETPYFNHQAFFSNLEKYRNSSRDGLSKFGSQILYAEVITSTNTVLEKNPRLLACLPSGFTATATVQVAGRGRGANAWVSPPGQMILSTVVRHPAHLMTKAPVVFIQYLAAMAIVQGIKSYDRGYDDMPVKLKWPNDIYALDPTKPDGKTYTKIGGILVNAQYSGQEYIAIVGIGLNAINAAPTTSLNALVDHLQETRHTKLTPLSLERLLARILTKFESLYNRFLNTGFDKAFRDMYYDSWLHTDQIVTLESEGGARAKIRGITSDYGLLMAEELGWEDRPTGRILSLQSDSNSFDFFRGLVKRKT